MTILSDFVAELATELDARAVDGLPLPGIDLHRWQGFVSLLIAIDRNDTLVATREKLEQIALLDERSQDRLRAMLPLLLQILPPGTLQ